MLGSSGAIPVFGYHRWWTFLSAGWLHGNLLHIAFNMMWVRQLAPATAELYGAPRMVLIYIVSSVTGFFLSSAAADSSVIEMRRLQRISRVTGSKTACEALITCDITWNLQGFSGVCRR